MLPGETIHSGAPGVCNTCHTPVTLEVLHSAAGYYIGTQCECGPYTRESHYYRTHAEAKTALDTNKINWR